MNGEDRMNESEGKKKQNESSFMYEIDPTKLQTHMKCGDYIKEEERLKQSENEQLKVTSYKISIQVENVKAHYEILRHDLLNELKSNQYNEQLIVHQSCYCASKQNYQRLTKQPSLLLELNQLKVIQTTNKYQIYSSDNSVLLPFYSIQRNEVCFNELTFRMHKQGESDQFIKVLGDKNLSCDPFICIETLEKDYQSKVDDSQLALNHQESYASIVQDENYQNTPFNRMRKNSNLLLFSAQQDPKIKQRNEDNKQKVEGGVYFKKDDLYVFNVDEHPIKDFKFKNKENKKSKEESKYQNASVSTQILLSLPNINIDVRKDSVENLTLLLLSLQKEAESLNNYAQESAAQFSLKNIQLSDKMKDQNDSESDADKRELILNIYTNNIALSYHTSDKDEIGFEINSFQAKHDFSKQQFKYSIYDMIIIDTQQAKPILGQPLRLVESTKIVSKYRQQQEQCIIVYKQGVYTQHLQFSLGKQPIRVNIHRILSTASDEEKMNSSYYFTQRMIMIPKQNNLSDQQEKDKDDDKYDMSDWMVKFKCDGINGEYTLKLFGCIFRLTDFTLPFLDEIQFLVENINDMVKQIDGERRQNNIQRPEYIQNTIQLDQQQYSQMSTHKVATKINIGVQNSALDIFMFYNQNYLEKGGGLSRMSYSQQVIDLELKKYNYYSNNRLCILIPDCSISIQQDVTQDINYAQSYLKNGNVQSLNLDNIMSVKVSGYLHQLSGYFLQFDDHSERLNSILLLDYSQSIVLMTEESQLKQMNFKQIFNIHTLGIKAEIANNQSQISIETKGIQILLCKDTMKYIMNFYHLLAYNVDILADSANRRNQIAEQYIRMQSQKQIKCKQSNQYHINNNNNNYHLPYFEIKEDEIELQDSQNDTYYQQNDITKQNAIGEAQKEKQEVLQVNRGQSMKSKQSNRKNSVISSRSVFRTHCRQIKTLEEDDMNILQAEKSYFNNTQDFKHEINQIESQSSQSISFSFSLLVDDFQINVFKGLDFNYDLTSVQDRDPFKRNLRSFQSYQNNNNNYNNANINNINMIYSSDNNLNQTRKLKQQKQPLLPSNTFISLKQSKIFNFIENYGPTQRKFEIKRQVLRTPQKENIRDYQNRMQIVVKGAHFKTEEYIVIDQKQGQSTKNHIVNPIKNSNNPKQQNDNKRKKVFLSIKKFEIIDELKNSSIKKFLTQKKKKKSVQSQSQSSIMHQIISTNSQSINAQHQLNSSLAYQGNDFQMSEIEYETGIDFMNLEIDFLEETPEHIKIQGGLKIHPLQLYIHGVTLDFLIDFFDLKNEIQQALLGSNNKMKVSPSKSSSPKKKKQSSKKQNKNNQVNTRNEWEIVEGDKELEDSQNIIENGNNQFEQYDNYESSCDSSDEENKELIFDNNESLIKYYYQKNNLNHESPIQKGRGLFSAIDDINPFQLYKNKYSFETFDTKKASNIPSQTSQQVLNQNTDTLNRTCIEFTSSKSNKSSQLNDISIENKQSKDENKLSKDNQQQIDSQLLRENQLQKQVKQSNYDNNSIKEIKLMNGNKNNESEEKKKNQQKNKEDYETKDRIGNENANEEEDEDFDEELDNISFSSLQTSYQTPKYRIEFENFEVQETEISLDYDPRAIDLFQLMNDFKMEALNLSSIKGINFCLPSLYITKKNFNSVYHIIQIAINTYQKDILENQFSYLDLAQKVNLLKSASKIFSSMVDIVTVPFERYQAKETVVEGTLEGTKTVAKMISYQALDISSSILSTVNSTFNLFGVKSRPTLFLTKILRSIRKQVNDNDDEAINNDEKYKQSSGQD